MYVIGECFRGFDFSGGTVLENIMWSYSNWNANGRALL